MHCLILDKRWYYANNNNNNVRSIPRIFELRELTPTNRSPEQGAVIITIGGKQTMDCYVCWLSAFLSFLSLFDIRIGADKCSMIIQYKVEESYTAKWEENIFSGFDLFHVGPRFSSVQVPYVTF